MEDGGVLSGPHNGGVGGSLAPVRHQYLHDGSGDGTLGYAPGLKHGVTGKGLNDYDAIFRILAENNYRGWVSIEDGMNGMDEMAESLAFLRRMSAKYFPEA